MTYGKALEIMRRKLPAKAFAARYFSEKSASLAVLMADGETWKEIPCYIEHADQWFYADEFELIDIPPYEFEGFLTLVGEGDVREVHFGELDDVTDGQRGAKVVTTYRTLEKLLSNGERLFRVKSEVSEHWKREIDAIKKACESEADLEMCLEVVEKMVRKGLVAESQYDGHESCWYVLSPAKFKAGIQISSRKRAEEVDYERIETAFRDDLPHGGPLLAMTAVNDKEVAIPTEAAFKLFGVEITKDSVVAHPDHQRIHDDWRRARWTPTARKEDVRIYVNHYGKDDHSRIGYAKGDIRIEGGSACNTIAGWREGSPVQFHYTFFSALDPFQTNTYENVDALIAALHKDGRFVTDYRKVIGKIDNEEDLISYLKKGYVIERERDPLLMLPRENKVHGELIALDREMVSKFGTDGLIVKVGSYSNDYFSCDVFAHLASDLAKNAPKERRPKKKRDRSKIVARDDDGKTITKNDLIAESYKRPLDGMPLNLMPPFDFDGTEDDWDELQLIESVKARRRLEKEGDNSGSDDWEFSAFS